MDTVTTQKKLAPPRAWEPHFVYSSHQSCQGLQLVNANTKKTIAMLYRTGYKKAHYRHLPVVLTQSTLNKYFYLAQRANWRDENCDSVLPFALPNDVNV